jgi:DNA-binding response OmpR family regulator
MLMTKQKTSAEVISMIGPMIECSQTLNDEPWQGPILVIEDDDPTLAKIMRTLVRSHFQALEARTGEEGLKMFETREFDLIVLDILLPGMDGFEVCRSIRDSRKPTPIIFLTTLGDTENLVRGLTMGADDYMVKPFKPEELVARIRTVLRRKQEVPAATHLKLRDLDLEYHSQKCFKNGRELDLTPTEFHLLMELCSTPGQAVSRSVLSNSVWGPSHHVSEKSLDVYIARLRQKVEDDPTEPSLIRTVRGYGYVCE